VSETVQDELVGMPEPTVLRRHSHAGQTVVSYGSRVAFCYDSGDTAMRNLAVVALTDAVGASQQNVSKHLGVLHDAGIVARRKEGTQVYYRVVDVDVFQLCETVCGSVQRQVAELNAIFEGVGR